MKKTIFCIIFVFIVFFFGRNLNPFSNSMFTFHDETQPARIEQFVLDLKNLQIPPRFAPDFSFKLGYPVFNFYAPTSYWITSIFSLIGFNTINALKFSFLLSILVGFISTYFFLKEYFDFFPSLTGAVLYISSLYYPLDIFVRGNLGEVWFLALFPLGLFFLVKNAKKPSRFIFFATVIGLFLLFTAHNLLSTMAIMICLFFILLLPHKKINSCAFIFSLLLAGYFFLPLLLENHLTYAKEIATATKYWQHFVCPQQLWQSPWGFGGSTAGCTDGMSFKIGKMQLVLGGLGMLLFFLNLKKHTQKNNFSILYFLFFILLTFGSLFMTTYLSKPIWDLFSPILSFFQFPWRFIAFSLIGLVFFTVYFIHTIQFKFKNAILLFLAFFAIFNYSKYFAGQSISKQNFEKTYLSQEYIEKRAAYKIAEYLPRTANYEAWRKYEKIPLKKASINIHYFPFWNINVNGKNVIPTDFDELGRPLIELKYPSTIQITYRETTSEKVGNVITILTFGILLYIIKSKKLWKKIEN